MSGGRRFRVLGTVQGVGFRPFVYRLGEPCGITGAVWNDPGGVLIEAFGGEEALTRFRRGLLEELPHPAHIAALTEDPLPPRVVERFTIAPSQAGGVHLASIPPDLATCADCLAEIFDPKARRYRYAFTNCTACGPRFTIAADGPYDRARTSMARFAMCADCRREYEDPADRRFHAEPIACPACGPRLRLGAASPAVVEALDAPRRSLAEVDPVQGAASALAAGRVVAVKSLGGYHLAVDARQVEAVRALRRRKHRDHKPFALMVRDLEAARALAELDGEAERLLTSAARPIVLVERRDARLPEELAPGSRLLGLMLAYTPLHYLLLAEHAGPLVMTSGNLSDEPIAYQDGDAKDRLGGVADLLLTHDREIVNRADDSVARVIRGRPVTFRRSRGFVPEPVEVEAVFPEPILAVGGQLKNTFCIGLGGQVVFGPHVGDLDTTATYRSFVSMVGLLERFLSVRPAVVAHDLHPDYLTTRYAAERGGRQVAVQHHHAHIAAVMAEHRLAGRVVGVAFDGTGYGLDGTAWGGELFVVEPAGPRPSWADGGPAGAWRFDRRATLHPVPLAGGDRAVREAWRPALAALDEAFAGSPPLGELPLFARVKQEELEVVRRMIARRVNTPSAHGAGRWFDVFAALALGEPRARYEGELAATFEQAAEGEGEPWPYAVVRTAELLRLDLRPALAAQVAAQRRGVGPGELAARFHATLIQGTAALARRLYDERSAEAFVLAGGCFQNRRLTEGLARALSATGPVYHAERFPPGDGGLALGQLVLAAPEAGPGALP